VPSNPQPYCTAAYANECEVGEALAAAFAKGTVTRADVFVTSKLWNDRRRPEVGLYKLNPFDP
jgi:diketogulonate reductase-like aldo/keto reductase